MNNTFNIKTKIWLLLAAIIVLFVSGCSTERRANKAVARVNAMGEQAVRPWPKNYSFDEYSRMLKSAKVRRKVYKRRASQAQKAGNNKMAGIMNNNVKNYKKKIKRLKKDKSFYRVYVINEKKVKIQLKESEKAMKKKQKTPELKMDNSSKKREKEIAKRRKKNEKEGQKRLDDKKKRLEEEKKDFTEKVESYGNTIENKQKELDELQSIANLPENRNDVTLKEAINDLTRQVKMLKYKKKEFENNLNKVTLELDKLIEEHYTPEEEKQKKKEDSQMILSTDPAEVQTKPKK